MDLYRRVEQILEVLRPVFCRQATFEWFVLLLWGVLLTRQPPAITVTVHIPSCKTADPLDLSLEGGGGNSKFVGSESLAQRGLYNS